VNYSLPKLDLVVEETKFGAMENWGLILFDPRTILVDPEDAESDGINEKRWLVASVMAHEIAHQWFGNLVTLDWWNQMWLNEGFATYVSYIGAEVIDPVNLPWGRLLVEETLNVMQYDSDTNVHWAITDNVTSRKDIERMFGMFSYQKGGSVIRMMEGILGKEVFLLGVRNYLKAKQFSSAVEEDLFVQLYNVGVNFGVWDSSMSMVSVLKSWTDQAGYPLVTAVTSCAAEPEGECSVTLSQKWFVTSGETNGEERVFAVPVSIGAVDASGRPVTWIMDSSEVVYNLPVSVYNSSSTEPLIINHKATGYYRVNYDEANWEKIGNTLRLNPESIDELNRAAMICDLIALKANGDLSEDTFDAVTSGYNDPAVVPNWAWESCGNGFKENLRSSFRI